MAYRNVRKVKFTQIRNEPLYDPTLSLQAKGLLALMLSFPDDWHYHMTHLIKQSTNGRDATQNAMKELTDAGYVVRRAIGGVNAGGVDWYVSDDKNDLVDVVPSRRPENPLDGKTTTTNTQPTNTHLNKYPPSFIFYKKHHEE